MEGKAVFLFPYVMKKFKRRTALVRIPAGQTSATAQVFVEKGVRLFALATATPAPKVNCRLVLEEAGNQVEDPLNIAFFDGKIGHEEQRAAELSYKGGAVLDVTVKLAAVEETDLYIDVAFKIIQQEEIAADGTLIPGTQC